MGAQETANTTSDPNNLLDIGIDLLGGGGGSNPQMMPNQNDLLGGSMPDANQMNNNNQIMDQNMGMP